MEDEKSIIAQLPVLQSQEPPLQSGMLTHDVAGVGCVADPRSGSGFPVTGQYVGASDVLQGVPKGHIAPIIETDGTVRKVPAFICSDLLAYPALSIAPFLHLTSSRDWDATISVGAGILALKDFKT